MKSARENNFVSVAETTESTRNYIFPQPSTETRK